MVIGSKKLRQCTKEFKMTLEIGENLMESFWLFILIGIPLIAYYWRNND